MPFSMKENWPESGKRRKKNKMLWTKQKDRPETPQKIDFEKLLAIRELRQYLKQGKKVH